jgi:CRP/FNR family transcriptional regulator, cyclic AMP receptor protein
MIERFKGEPRRIREAILRQHCVANVGEVADKLCECLELMELQKDAVLFQEGSEGNDVYFILAGKVVVEIKNREISYRSAGQSVGEMTMIDVSERRSGTVRACDVTVLAKVSEKNFAAIAEMHPEVWRRLAIELATRLRQRAQYVRLKNVRPRIFLGSSVEGLPILKSIHKGFEHDDYLVIPWYSDVFTAGKGTMDALFKEIDAADFGVLVCTKDDLVESRGVEKPAPRDNVILELGMCLGAMGIGRGFMVKPRGPDLKVPTDLLGITPVDYEIRDLDPKNLQAQIEPVCTTLRIAITELKVR